MTLPWVSTVSISFRPPAELAQPPLFTSCCFSNVTTLVSNRTASATGSIGSSPLSYSTHCSNCSTSNLQYGVFPTRCSLLAQPPLAEQPDLSEISPACWYYRYGVQYSCHYGMVAYPPAVQHISDGLAALPTDREPI